MTKTTTFAATAAILLLTSGAALGADGQDGTSGVDPRRFDLSVGIGASIRPVYEGSDEYEVRPVPILRPRFGNSTGGRLTFRGIDDVRINLSPWERIRFGGVVGYNFGRDEDDADRIDGLGDIDGGLIAGGFVGYDVIDTDTARWTASVAYSSQITGDAFDRDRFANVPGQAGLAAFANEHGSQVDLSMAGSMILSPDLRMKTSFGTVYADDDYMRTHFGISQLQAANSTVGLAAFTPDAGLKSIYADVSFSYDLTERWQITAGAGYSRLLNDAADSPVTASENQLEGRLGVSYRFEF